MQTKQYGCLGFTPRYVPPVLSLRFLAIRTSSVRKYAATCVDTKGKRYNIELDAISPAIIVTVIVTCIKND